MGLREEIAKVRLARGRLELTRAKLEKLDRDRQRVDEMLKRSQGEQPPRPRERRRLDLD